jgi:Gnt-I system high-affinity gluconate transporter
MGVTLMYGMLIAIPTIIIAGPIFSQFLKKIDSVPLKTFRPEDLPADQLPGGFNSFITALLPVILLMLTTGLPYILPANPVLLKANAFIGEGPVVMIIALAVATYSLGLGQGKKMKDIMAIYGDAVKDISVILLIIAGAGAFKQVFTDSGVNTEIGHQLQNINLHPLILGWLIAALIRACLGSATVAGLTTAGIIAPLMIQAQVNPNLMVLSIGAGSLAFSHVTDSGFWLYKEYFNLSIKDTLKSWSAMESIVAVCGLGGVLLLNAFV